MGLSLVGDAFFNVTVASLMSVLKVVIVKRTHFLTIIGPDTYSFRCFYASVAKLSYANSVTIQYYEEMMCEKKYVRISLIFSEEY